MKIETIFFDFDGVITESVDVKTDAFYQLYIPYGEETAQKVIQHHRDNGGMSRFEKFRYYHQHFLGTALSEQQVSELADQFSELVKQKVIESEEVTGATNFLKKYSDEKNFWVITGTPTDEIKQILQARNMEQFFKGAFGSPEKKEFWVKKIMEDHKLNADECIFAGDALADYKAAQLNTIAFALRNTKDNMNLFQNIPGILHFTDFTEFESLIKDRL